MFNASNHRGVKGWLVLVGGFLLNSALGGLFTAGNITPYVTSYIRVRSSPSTLRMEDTTWMASIGIFFQCVAMVLSGAIVDRIGSRMTALSGGLLVTAAVMSSYFTIKWHFIGFLLTYGMVYGIGVGLACPIPIAISMKWIPERKGLVTGFVLTGFGAGEFVLTQIQTMFINPGNLIPDDPPNMTVPLYFSQDVLLDRVPYLFLLLGGCYFVLVVISVPMISSLTEEKATESKPLLETGQNNIILQDQNRDRTTEETEKNMMNKQLENDSNAEHEFSTSEMLRSRYFYMIWFIFFMNTQSIIIAQSLYKVYGQSYIQDDFFLGMVGSFANAFNAAGRIFWGMLNDHFSFRVTMTGLCICTSILFMTFLTAPLTPAGQKPITFIWTCLIFFTFTGNFPLLPAVISDTFGNKAFVTKYGLGVSTLAVASPIISLMVTEILPRTGWVGLYSVVSASSLIAGILALFYDAKKSDGRPV